MSHMSHISRQMSQYCVCKKQYDSWVQDDGPALSAATTACTRVTRVMPVIK